jgi:hypothetical protein
MDSVSLWLQTPDQEIIPFKQNLTFFSQFINMESILSPENSSQTPTSLVNFYHELVTGPSTTNDGFFATFALMDIELDLDDDIMSLDDPMDWEDFATLGPMEVELDLDDNMSLADPMDWEDSDSCGLIGQ